MSTSSSILTKCPPNREVFKEFTFSGVTLTFSKMPDDPIYFAQTPIGYYEIEYIDGGYSLLLPWDECPFGVYNTLDDAMQECVKQHALAFSD
ncbi:hypothetical protein [uncultured Porphyromonas sp.]|uniref:hypothetical protein n=1 Tax=uncultured Porphyromonas sp. TaxID=159274 RepID=UPI00262D0277|nr:hypothetical protein [uncultured Porphyromonas sp.]